MLVGPQSVDLLRVADGAIVPGRLVTLTRELAKLEIDSKWWTLPGTSEENRKAEGDHSWRWAKTIGEFRSKRWFEAKAVQTDDSRIQGGILYWTNTPSFVIDGKGAI